MGLAASVRKCTSLSPRARSASLASLLALAAGCASAPRSAGSAGAAPEPIAVRAPVVVAVVVDQLAAWVAHERLPALPEDGGFARLRREGTWVIEARHPHAATDTAPGHAMLLTGATPDASGIFANEVIDEKGHQASILRDPRSKLVGPGGAGRGSGSSPARLRVDTLADRLRARHPDAVIVGLSLKDRGAIFGCGRRPDACVWFDTRRDAFVTSTAFAAALPAWVLPEGGARALDASRAPPWEPLDRGWVERHAGTPDDQPGEGDWGGLSRFFPHHTRAAEVVPSAFRASPAGDERVLALALASLRQERFGKAPTLLAISLSSNDYVGHTFGPDSWEAWDLLRRLDAALGRFFRALDAALGEASYAVVLGADHGVAVLPETHGSARARPWCQGGPDRWQRPCEPGGRLSSGDFADRLDRAASAVLGEAGWVAGVADPYVYLSPKARGLPAEGRGRLQEALARAAREDACVAAVFDPARRPAACPPRTDERLEALVCRSMPHGVEGALYVVPRPGCFFGPDFVPGQGAGHGTPYLYDRAVPVLARAPGRVAAGRVIEGPLSSAVFTSTVAALLGIPAPDAASDMPPLGP